jgi:glycerol uptake facilitator-like aquaporin
MSNRIAPKLLAEFIGTFGFVFIGAGTAAVIGGAAGLPGIVAVAFAHALPSWPSPSPTAPCRAGT